MIGYTNPLRRFLLRKDLYKRVKARISARRRKLSKNEVGDLASLFRDSPPATVLDVGANVGFMSWQFAKAFPKATVFALEPDPAPRRILEQTHGTNPRIRIFPVAAADCEGELPFVQRRVSCNSSLLTVDGRADSDAVQSIQVKAATLDQFCCDQAIRHIDLLKTDTEGADLLVLRGAKGLFERNCVDVVMSEVLFVPTFQGQASFDQIAGFLKDFGFLIFNIYIGREEPNGQACYGNAIFIRNGFGKPLPKAALNGRQFEASRTPSSGVVVPVDHA